MNPGAWIREIGSGFPPQMNLGACIQDISVNSRAFSSAILLPLAVVRERSFVPTSG